jgi:succinyl-CoA synthetase beta subunit
MKIHEYQAKQVLRQAGVNVPKSIVARSADEASKAFADLGGPIAVVKAQIHAGGRGKGTIKTNPNQRGVQLVRSASDAATVAGNILGQELVTIQTGPGGQAVRQVLVEAGCDIDRELYLAILVDRAVKSAVVIASAAGGMNIEEVAHDTPELIFNEKFHPDQGLFPFQIRKLSKKLGLTGAAAKGAGKFLNDLCKVFVAQDCSMLEINPLVVTKSGELICLDCKMTFDDNATFRHPAQAELRDLAEEEPTEVRAADAGLSYVKLDGNIGCLVNGAGLAMSTMDLINLHGGSPANFLDVGGGANVETVTEAFKILLGDKNVKGVLVNIFGGIMKCTTIATAIVAAFKTVGFNVPLVVRLEGTEVAEGRKILADSGAAIITADGLTDAAQKIVAAVKKAG